PFAVAQPPPAGADDDRAQSWRVYAIVLGLSGLAFATMVLAVVAVLVMPGMLEGDAPSEVPATTRVEAPMKKTALDTGEEAPPPPPPPPPPARKSPRASGGGGGSSAPAAAPARVGPATLTIKVPDGTPTTSIEVTCPSGFRQRGSFG